MTLADYARDTALKARDASRRLVTATPQQKADWLNRCAAALRKRTPEIVAANEQDVANAPEYGLNAAAIDRLKLDAKRIEAIAKAVEEIIVLPDPVGEIIDKNLRPNGLVVTRVRVPLGVVFFIYESRPNVTVDAAALCVKSGNAVILRGGKEAFHSNQALYQVLADSLEAAGLPRDAVQLVSTTDREAVGHFLTLKDLIDLTIPRGGKSLIERVAAEATMPVMKHFDGVCHVYIDKGADLQLGLDLLINSKCQRPGVCNAAESFLVHADVADAFLPIAGPALAANKVEVRGDARVCQAIPEAKPATDEDYRTEYLDLKISAKVVGSLDEAIDHINTYGSRHTDTIVTRDQAAARRFTQEVDASAVIVNASTRFNDGGEFGLGAEIGISTDKYHARGPCGLKELTSYKYVVWGEGQRKG